MWVVAIGRFLEVSQSSEFMFLPPDRICQLLSDDMLIVNSEMDVFCALLRWLDYDRDGRLCHAAHLLQDAVRLHCITPECIVSKVETVDWLFDAVPECQVVTNEAMRSVSSCSCRGTSTAKIRRRNMEILTPNFKGSSGPSGWAET